MSVGDAQAWIQAICTIEDLDPPMLARARKSPTTRASADLDGNVICLRGTSTTGSTIVHEIAHISCRADSHGEIFRDELVRLMRRHISVEHASLLWSLFVSCGLTVGPWPASARRR